MNSASFGHFPSENHLLFSAYEPGKNLENQEDFFENRSYQETESDRALL